MYEGCKSKLKVKSSSKKGGLSEWDLGYRVARDSWVPNESINSSYRHLWGSSYEPGENTQEMFYVGSLL